jgi:HNH endonuclease
MTRRIFISEKTKRIVAAAQKWRCATCRQLLDAHFETDHDDALALGGSNRRSNLRALCPCCHRAKTHEDMTHLRCAFGRNFFMRFQMDDGGNEWFRGVVLRVARNGYSVLFEDGDTMVVPRGKTSDVGVWVWAKGG